MISTRFRRSSAWALLAVGLAVAAPAAGAGGEGPRALVDKLSKDVLAVLGDKGLSADQKRQRLEQLVDRKSVV